MEGNNKMKNNVEKNEIPVTSDIPMLHDETAYKIYIIPESVKLSFFSRNFTLKTDFHK